MTVREYDNRDKDEIIAFQQARIECLQAEVRRLTQEKESAADQ